VNLLRDTDAHGVVYSVEDDSQFVRIILREEATFPHGQYGWSTLREQGQNALAEIGRTLMSENISQLYRQIRVIGHSDDVPYVSAGFTNWELSASRAAVVARYLVNEVGVDQCKISAAGVGPYYPLEGLDTLPVRVRNERNRRIEIEIVPARAAGRVEGPKCNSDGDGSAQRVRNR
jgi:chemotaxis protein MotB